LISRVFHPLSINISITLPWWLSCNTIHQSRSLKWTKIRHWNTQNMVEYLIDTKTWNKPELNSVALDTRKPNIQAFQTRNSHRFQLQRAWHAFNDNWSNLE
jgi:hypothetical protein